jgi:hypothetical protein
MYRKAEWIPNQRNNAYRSAWDNVFRKYSIASLPIKCIYCDNEYRLFMKELEEKYQVKINYSSAQEHAPEIERSIRVIKERF